MSILLREILELPNLKGIKTRAGHKGLDQAVRWVNVLEMLDELDQLSEGELFVTTAVGLDSDPNLEKHLVSHLKKKRLVGLAIQTGFYLKEIPQTLIDLCEQEELPLLEIPEEMSFGELTRSVALRIIKQQSELLENTQHIQKGMTDLLLEKQGLAGIVKRLWELLGKPIQILDARGHSLASFSDEGKEDVFSTKGPIAERDQIREIALKQKNALPIQWKKRLLYPLISGETYYGCIWVESKIKADSSEAVILASAATISILEIIKREEVWEAEERIRGDFLDDLLEGSWVQQEDMYHRGKRLGFDLDKPFVLFAVEGFSGLDASESSIEKRRNILLWLWTLLEEQGRQGLMRESQDHVVVFLPLEDQENEESFQKFMQKYHEELVRQGGSEISIGISRIKKGISNLTSSLKEARSALQLGKRLKESGKVYSYSDLGPYCVLGNLQSEEDLQGYYRQTIASLVDYDQKHNTDFVQTLQTFFEANLELRETARRLFIHRHTLSYRLKRIEQICGLSPLEYWGRVQLEIGILLLPLIK